MRASNLERQKWRSRCREDLSRYIQTQLGITVEPAQVRLLPRLDDPYRWRAVPEKQHLFSKNLSDHSIGAYKSLCDGIGKTFEAVCCDEWSTMRNGDDIEAVLGTSMLSTEADIGFTGKISLCIEQQKRLDLENTVNCLQLEIAQTQAYLEESLKAAEGYVTVRHRHLDALHRVLPILEELRQDISNTSLQYQSLPTSC
ncbi:hypothetical protein BU24DRAFT_429292 [Aaosphaeria arxii CBS 175.79]|uniref:Uncharacterized protein n=1 Tax=Aaosphaeria arxii CBS 175.79 TaxID=1450172 RepID=A0A6A5X738_9PLEO|nr:uncharacterized protein BU24DRAFT_429292 [Aaosphaeria arxii CBS 175.79]KAF2008722.1 hypothetical protein BU24DRAFT_429292 [Aaosphaeria arxii CBS 175.79]